MRTTARARRSMRIPLYASPQGHRILGLPLAQQVSCAPSSNPTRSEFGPCHVAPPSKNDDGPFTIADEGGPTLQWLDDADQTIQPSADGRTVRGEHVELHADDDVAQGGIRPTGCSSSYCRGASPALFANERRSDLSCRSIRRRTGQRLKSLDLNRRDMLD